MESQKTKSLYDQWLEKKNPPPPPAGPWLRRIGIVVVLGLFTVMYLFLAGRLLESTNADPKAQDQKHNMRRALVARDQLLEAAKQTGIREAWHRWLPRQTDGVVAPLWPWLAARVAPPHITLDESSMAGTESPELMDFFAKGKRLNVFISLGGLLLVSIYTFRRLSFLGATLFLLLAGFGAFLPRAVYFQPEPLFYVFFLTAWILALRLLEHNSLVLHAAFGLICGLAYITKTSIEPLLLGWLGVTAYRWVLGIFRARSGASRWCCQHHFLGVIVVFLTYTATIWPTLMWNKEKFGSALHTYPRYWMWMDDFDTQGYQWMRDHSTADSLKRIPEAEIPNAQNYLAKHPWPTWFHRLADGTYAKMEQFLAPKPEFKKPKEGWKRLLDLRGAYLGVLAAMVLIFTVTARKRAKQDLELPPPLTAESGIQTIFVIGTFVGYALAFGWYHVIGRGERFMLMLYAPLAFSFILALEHLSSWFGNPSAGAACKLPRCGKAWWTAQAFFALLIAVILWRVIRVMHDASLPWFHPEII